MELLRDGVGFRCSQQNFSQVFAAVFFYFYFAQVVQVTILKVYSLSPDETLPEGQLHVQSLFTSFSQYQINMFIDQTSEPGAATSSSC